MRSIHQQECPQLGTRMQRQGYSRLHDRLTKGLEPKREREIVGAPRRLTWADIGGKPADQVETPHLDVVRTCLNAVYTNADRRHKVYEMRKALRTQTIAHRGTNALTGAFTINRRRTCRYPTPREPAMPQQDWRPLSPGATPRGYDASEVFGYHDDRHPVIAPVVPSVEAEPHAAPPSPSGVPIPWPGDDFF